MMSTAEIRQIAERVIATRLAHGKIVDCRVDVETDFDGEEIVRVTAVSEALTGDARERLEANMAIRDELLQHGDNRFVFLDLEEPGDLPDEDEVDDHSNDQRAS